MIRLDLSTRRLEVILAASTSTAQVQTYVSFYDTNPQGEVTKGGQYVSTSFNNTSSMVCPGPTQNYVRNIDTITLYNNDTGNVMIQARVFDTATSTATVVVRKTLVSSAIIAYEDKLGWYYLTFP